MGNNCCKRPDDENAFKTLETNGKDKEKKRLSNTDKYPHDSDSGFKANQKKDRIAEIKPFSNDINEGE